MANPNNRQPGQSTENKVRQANGQSTGAFDETPPHLKNQNEVGAGENAATAEANASSEDAPAQAAQVGKSFERAFTKTKRIISDVFKLLAAPVVKQVGIEKDPDKDPDSFRNFEHTHIFRTFDSDGKRHDRCCMTAGHFHDIEWVYDSNGKPIVKKVSGPKVLTRKQVKGKWTQVSVPANSYDDHTHDMEYLLSHEVEARRTNIEATKVIAFEAQKGANPGGVQERG